MRGPTPLLLIIALLCGCTERGGEEPAPAPAAPAEPAGLELPPEDAGPAPAPYELSWRQDQPPRSAPPMSLTASDGTGLGLVSLAVKAVIDDPLAFTELHLTFDNPEPRQREGRFEITLPDGASVSRLAMRIRDEWQEGEVLERQDAHEVFEDFLHCRQDPALLESDAGNRFRARVFPIPPRGRKELIISYSEELGQTREPYRVLLAGLPALESLSVEVLARSAGAAGPATSPGESERLTINREGVAPEGDLELFVPRDRIDVGLRSGDLAVARFAPQIDTEAGQIEKLVVLFDTSASRGIDLAGQAARLGEIVGQLLELNRRDPELVVACFDQAVQEVFHGKASGFDAAVAEKIAERRPLGASDLAGALAWVAANHAGADRVLVFGDGVATAGASEPDMLRAAAAALAGKDVNRIDAVVDGAVRDTAALAAITRGNLPRDGVVVDARLTPRSIATKLLRATRSGIGIAVPGASWVWPETLDGVQPGDQVLVYAELPNDQSFKIRADDDPRGERVIALGAAEGPLLERAWIRANIARLEHDASQAGSEADKEELRQRIVYLSKRHRVLSEHTALLVLETEADYRRYGIDRASRADILTVGSEGLVVEKRTDAPLVALSADEIDAAERERGQRIKNLGRRFCWGGRLAGIGSGAGIALRNLFNRAGTNPLEELSPSDLMGSSGSTGTNDMGLAGIGGGGDSGAGIGLGDPGSTGYGMAKGGLSGRHAGSPKIKPGNAMIQGGLPEEVIRRIIRRHLNEVKFCFEKELQKDPKVGGRVVVKFIISPTGAVVQSALVSSTAKNSNIEQCVVHAVRRWAFPRPESGGIVLVTAPFTLTGYSYSGGRGWIGPKYWPRAKPKPENAYEGRFADVMAEIEAGDRAGALSAAWAWWGEAPTDVAALIALGEALEADGQLDLAARIYGSLIDLFPSRADLRRMAGERLERLGDTGLGLAIDTFRAAVDQRPDHPTGHRLYAFALAKAGRYEQAFAALRKGYEREYPAGRFRRVKRVLGEDLGLIAAAWIRATPEDEQRVRDAIKALELAVASKPSTRFVLYWESDLTNVDLRIHDKNNHVAYWKSPTLPGGGALYANVVNGYGPECFAIQGEPRAFPYTMQAHYSKRGPMGYGMGKLQIVEHDGRGILAFSERPFLIQRDGAYVNLGTLDAPMIAKGEER